MSQNETETEHDRKVVEYWKKFSIYDIGSSDLKDDNDRLPYKPTAVLSKTPPNQQSRKFSIYDMRFS